ncbi:hypothetical protein HMPREF0972_01166 [Actinomyces sp. oral taxon 848 str. F0332]|nr:hypothetical protein HMPREF0972_01166 [Actinomyces sp. oral taxon 848 str. F0332]
MPGVIRTVCSQTRANLYSRDGAQKARKTTDKEPLWQAPTT